MPKKKIKMSPYSYVGIVYDDVMKKKTPKKGIKLIKDITKNQILNIVSEECEVSVEELLSDSRKQEIVDARHILFAALRRKFQLSLETIGKMIGNRDHTTVLHGLKKFELRLMNEPTYKRMANNVFFKIGIENLETSKPERTQSEILKSINKFSCLFILGIFLLSCNPKMHIIGYGMRKFNTSLNKYSKDKPYIRENSQIKK